MAILNSGLDTLTPVKYRQVTDILVVASCGDRYFKDYMDRYYFLTDKIFTNRYSSTKSLITSKSSAVLKGLRFDPASLESMQKDPGLEKFRLVYW